jgi:hypothetical protein
LGDGVCLCGEQGTETTDFRIDKVETSVSGRDGFTEAWADNGVIGQAKIDNSGGGRAGGWVGGLTFHVEPDFFEASTTIASASNGARLPQETIKVASTRGFPASGAIHIRASTAQTVMTSVTCAGITAISFTACAAGTGTLAAGQGLAVTLARKPYHTRIDHLYTKGFQSFTASGGVTSPSAELLRIDIGALVHDEMAASNLGSIEVNAATVSVGHLLINTAATGQDEVTIEHGGVTRIGRADFNGTGTGYLINAGATAYGRPRVQIREIRADVPSSKGYLITGADFSCQSLTSRTSGSTAVYGYGAAMNVEATEPNTIRLEKLRFIDSSLPSTGYLILVTTSGTAVGDVEIGSVTANDGRAAKAAGIFAIDSRVASRGVRISGAIANPDGLAKPVAYLNGGSYTYYRRSGVQGRISTFVGTGPPGGMIAAPVGSTYVRTDRGAKTVRYLKEKGAGTKDGWVGE